MEATSSRGNITNSLITLTLLLLLLYWGQGILKPLAFACLLAVLLISPAKLFEKAGFPRGIAALISLLLAFVVFFVIFYFLSTSIISFKKDLPLMLQRITDGLTDLEMWAQKKFHVSTEKMQEFVNTSTEDALPSASYIINTTLTTVSSGIFLTIIIFIYTFLLLLYRSLIVRFFCSLMAKEHTPKIHTILTKIRYVIKSYIVGLFIEMVVVAALNATAFFILGVRYALLLAIISAIFNIIPYLGIFTALILSVLITFTTNTAASVLGVAAVVVCTHLIDSNFLLPKVVGSKVKINALVTILGVILGEHLWGI